MDSQNLMSLVHTPLWIMKYNLCPDNIGNKNDIKEGKIEEIQKLQVKQLPQSHAWKFNLLPITDHGN